MMNLRGFVLVWVKMHLIAENTKLKKKLRQMVERKRANQLMWVSVMTVAVVIMAVVAHYV